MGRMIYVVDGHNLIPYLPGFSLSAIDDEERLIALLQVFCRVRRHTVEVFFDGAPPGQSGMRAYGAVKAHFVRSGRTADDAIRTYLHRLGPRAAQVTVVTSDNQVRTDARDLRSSLLNSDAFAAELLRARQSDRSAPASNAKDGLDPGEVEEWLRLFGG